MAGAKTAGIIGLLLSASMDFGYYSMTTMYSNSTVIIVDIIAYTVYMSITGAFIGWGMGMVKK